MAPVKITSPAQIEGVGEHKDPEWAKATRAETCTSANHLNHKPPLTRNTRRVRRHRAGRKRKQWRELEMALRKATAATTMPGTEYFEPNTQKPRGEQSEKWVLFALQS